MFMDGLKMERGEGWGGKCSIKSGSIWGKAYVHTCFNLFLKILTERTATAEAGSLVQDLATLLFGVGLTRSTINPMLPS